MVYVPYVASISYGASDLPAASKKKVYRGLSSVGAYLLSGLVFYRGLSSIGACLPYVASISYGASDLPAASKKKYIGACLLSGLIVYRGLSSIGASLLSVLVSDWTPVVKLH